MIDKKNTINYFILKAFILTAFFSSDNAQGAEVDSVVVKVHYTYIVALSVPMDTPYQQLKEQIAQKLGQPASQLRLR